MNFLFFCFLLQNMFLPAPPSEGVYKVEKLNSKVNSARYDEINPVVSRDGMSIYFTRVGSPDFNRTIIDEEKDMSTSLGYVAYQDHLRSIFQSLSNNKVDDPVTNPFNQDVWIAEWSGGDFNNIHHPDYPLNSALPNSVCSLTPRNNEIIVINEFYKDGSMYKGFSTIKAGINKNWLFPKPLYIYDFYSNSSDVNLTMSDDGYVIIMSLNRPSSQGSNDLYVSFKVDDNLYSSPLPLSKVINTSYRETTPYISRDGQFLYFSSNRPGGYGGNDIYVARRLDDTWQNWSSPELLPTPINSAYDDSQPFVNETTGYIYFTSKRDGTSDIFRAMYHPIAENVRKKTLVIRVVNSMTGQPIDADIVVGNQEDGFYTKTLTSSGGYVHYSFIKPENIMLKARKIGYTGENHDVNLSELFLNEITIQETTLFLDPMENEARFSLDNIYFLQSTATIKDESYEALDQIVTALRKNKSLKIKIIGHTDNIGSEASLIWLSQQRANALKNYLIKDGGIEPERVSAEGRGKSEPLNDNSTEEKKSKNRRVEFTVYK